MLQSSNTDTKDLIKIMIRSCFQLHSHKKTKTTNKKGKRSFGSFCSPHAAVKSQQRIKKGFVLSSMECHQYIYVYLHLQGNQQVRAVVEFKKLQPNVDMTTSQV